jgi:hypothetical protein
MNMEISDTKIATCAIVIIIAILATTSYLSGVISETLSLGET